MRSMGFSGVYSASDALSKLGIELFALLDALSNSVQESQRTRWLARNFHWACRRLRLSTARRQISRWICFDQEFLLDGFEYALLTRR